MTTAMMTDLELMRTRMSGAIGYHLPRSSAPGGCGCGRARSSRCRSHHPGGAGGGRRRYPEASVHPFVLGAPLLHDCAVREYQIRQTERGADIAAVTDGDFDPAGVVAAVERTLREAGVGRPQVGVRRVGALDRDPMTSKIRRFGPLPAPRRPEPAAPPVPGG